jgi:hypothetical protein
VLLPSSEEPIPSRLNKDDKTLSVLESSLRVMEMFRANQTSVLITTAAATRGLDFPQVREGQGGEGGVCGARRWRWRACFGVLITTAAATLGLDFPQVGGEKREGRAGGERVWRSVRICVCLRRGLHRFRQQCEVRGRVLLGWPVLFGALFSRLCTQDERWLRWPPARCCRRSLRLGQAFPSSQLILTHTLPQANPREPVSHAYRCPQQSVAV